MLLPNVIMQQNFFLFLFCLFLNHHECLLVCLTHLSKGFWRCTRAIFLGHWPDLSRPSVFTFSSTRVHPLFFCNLSTPNTSTKESCEIRESVRKKKRPSSMILFAVLTPFLILSLHTHASPHTVKCKSHSCPIGLHSPFLFRRYSFIRMF